jgi:hypothetical protein
MQRHIYTKISLLGASFPYNLTVHLLTAGLPPGPPTNQENGKYRGMIEAT